MRSSKSIRAARRRLRTTTAVPGAPCGEDATDAVPELAEAVGVAGRAAAGARSATGSSCTMGPRERHGCCSAVRAARAPWANMHRTPWRAHLSLSMQIPDHYLCLSSVRTILTGEKFNEFRKPSMTHGGIWYAATPGKQWGAKGHAGALWETAHGLDHTSLLTRYVPILVQGCF